MAQRRPESAATELGLPQLTEELAALRQELAALRTTVAELVAALAPASAAAVAQSLDAGHPQAAPDSRPRLAAPGPEPTALSGEARPMGSSPSALLARRMADWRPPAAADRPRPGSVHDKYTKLVSSAHYGCVV